MKHYIYIIIILFVTFVYTVDSEFDEAAMFGDDNIVSEKDVVTEEKIDQEFVERHLGISGQIDFDNKYNISRSWLVNNGSFNDNEFSNVISGNLLFDIRIGYGIKSFLNFELLYYPNGYTTTDILNTSIGNVVYNDSANIDYSLKEFFFDFNVKRKAYFRIGKQVLKWGTCYFWNPTDLINVDRKDFNDLDDFINGSYGLKTHIPFGAKQNIYFFIDMNRSDNINQVGISGKYEFLLGRTELSISSWYQKDNNPVFGLDFSSRIINTDVRGELSIQYGANNNKLNPTTITEYIEDDKLLIKTCLGFTHYFDFGDIDDRISLSCEFYYNQYGYSDNLFGNTNAKNYLLLNNLYHPYNYSKYYSALFVTISKFINYDMTYQFNIISNLNDNSHSISNVLDYEPYDNFILSLNIIGNIGDKNTEFNLSGKSILTRITGQLIF